MSTTELCWPDGGELILNPLETAILERMAEQMPSLAPLLPKLIVTSRELTGAGSYTDFAPQAGAAFDPDKNPFDLDLFILIPGVEIGLGALLFFSSDSIKFLEIYCCGNAWYGNWEGYSLVPSLPEEAS